MAHFPVRRACTTLRWNLVATRAEAMPGPHFLLCLILVKVSANGPTNDAVGHNARTSPDNMTELHHHLFSQVARLFAFCDKRRPFLSLIPPARAAPQRPHCAAWGRHPDGRCSVYAHAPARRALVFPRAQTSSCLDRPIASPRHPIAARHTRGPSSTRKDRSGAYSNRRSRDMTGEAVCR